MGVVARGERRDMLTGAGVVRRSAAVVNRFVSMLLGIRMPEVVGTPQVEQVGRNGRQQHERNNRARAPHGDPVPASCCHG
ncbi:MAG: hypothetical protein F4Y73_16465 [Gemmatimonadetes bacterium]|nr:hypothetical protein [Gemmatimonadota bacterium]